MTTIFTCTSSGTNGDAAWRIVVPITGGAQGQVRVTFKNGVGSTAICNNASIGISNGTTHNTTATPIELLFSGLHGYTLASAASITSDWANLSGFTSSDKLVVDMDFVQTNALGCTTTGVTGAQQYFFDTAGTYYNQAAPAGFSTGSAGEVDGFVLIEVQSGVVAPPPPTLGPGGTSIFRAKQFASMGRRQIYG
jgi:hypothetical protein